MSFVAVLFALLLEQARPLAPGNGVHALMRVWVRTCARNFDTGQMSGAVLTLGLAVGLPALLAAGVYRGLNAWLGWPVGVVWSALILYAALGFRQFSAHFTQVRDALAAGDVDLAAQRLNQWQPAEVANLTREGLIARCINLSVLAAHRHVFGVLAWFTVLAALGLGPLGAVAYRLAELVPRYWRHAHDTHAQTISPALQQAADRLWQGLDAWPARMTAMGFAVMGNFEEAVDAWRRYAQHPVLGHDGVVLAATAGAVNVHLDGMGFDPNDRPVPQVSHLATVVGLVWRTVLLWMVLLALLTLARWLG
ncbi:MAG: CobD/CbiB family protein [Rhodoferax sp.]